MLTSQLLRIMYLGRKPKVADGLQTLMTERNRVSAHSDAGRAMTYEFEAVTNQRKALQLIRTQPPAVVLVELEKKSESRVRFCEMVRYRLPTAAILAVSACEPTQSFTFDGQIKMPLIPHQVFTTLDQVHQKCGGYLLQRGPLSLNIAARTVTTPSGEYTMTPKQCALLQMLMNHPNTIVKRSEIMKLIWETSYLDDTRTLDVHIRWLRERIEPDPSNPVYLKTVRGAGYRLNLG